MTTMNLTRCAQQLGVSTKTAQRWFHSGELPYPARKVGRLILVDMPDDPQPHPIPRNPQRSAPAPKSCQRTAVYLTSERVSKRRAAVNAWALRNGVGVDETHIDHSGSSSKLKRLLADQGITRIITDSHAESDLIAAALSAQSRQFIAVDALDQPKTAGTPHPFQPRLAHSAGA